MKRLVCVVEGKGEVRAIPVLVGRLLARLEATDRWFVDQEPVRQPRGHLVDEKVSSPERPCRPDEVARAVGLALKRRDVGAVVVLCDADDDCPATWGPSATDVVRRSTPGTGIMAVREYETWLVQGRSEEELHRHGVAEPEATRDAKGLLKRLVAGYKPTVHQLRLTRELDLDRVWARSDSFDKLVRSLAALCEVTPPARPPAA